VTYVVSLVGFMPPPRYDNVPWTQAIVQEAPAPGGPYVNIDTQALTPDADPSQPSARNVTTTAATLDEGWYRLMFVDVNGGESTPDDAVRNSESNLPLPPTTDAIRVASPLLRAAFPVPPTDQYQTADLRNLINRSIALVESATFRIIDPTLGDPSPEGYVGELVPATLTATAFEAVQRQAEVLQVTGDATFTQQAATGRRLRGFSAGPYSESYFAPNEFARKGVATRPSMSDDDTLDALLWALATEDARDYLAWRNSGITPPTGVATAWDYRKQQVGYSAGSLGGWPAGRGPDGY
jgi:hypothetical protein